MAEGIKKKLEFLREIDKFKEIKRACYTCGARRETDAEHSWHLGMFLLLLEKEFPEMDKHKMYKLCLMHDLPEVYAGDAHAYKPEERKGKEEREAKAAEQLYGMLPQEIREELHLLQQEYDKGASPEAKIVKALDKMQPILQNILSEGKAWKDASVSLEQMQEKKQPYLEHPVIKQLYQQLEEEARTVFKQL